MTAPYAQGTEVSPERSKAEIERTLKRYGAEAFLYGENQHGVLIQFAAHNRIVRFVLPLPARGDFEDYRARNNVVVSGQKAYDAEVRRRWRSLANAIKAKLEAVESGIVDFEREFLAQIVLPDDSTVGQWFGPQLEQVYRSGAMPAMLPALERPPREGQP